MNVERTSYHVRRATQSLSRKVKADASLQEKLKAAADADAVVAIAKAAGFVISADDLKKAQSEISEEELAGLSGGGQDFGAWFKENIIDNCVGMAQNAKDQGHPPW